MTIIATIVGQCLSPFTIHQLLLNQKGQIFDHLADTVRVKWNVSVVHFRFVSMPHVFDTFFSQCLWMFMAQAKNEKNVKLGETKKNESIKELLNTKSQLSISIPLHLIPCLVIPYNNEPQWSQNVGRV